MAAHPSVQAIAAITTAAIDTWENEVDSPWIFSTSAISGAAVDSGRRLASTASMSSFWISSVKSVPSARSTVSSGR